MSTTHRIGLLAGAAATLIHLIANPHYGFFRDELYFIICGQHPQWGYVDQPPLVPLLCALTQLFGHSLLALRAIPALLAGASIYVTCLLVAEFGGSAFACWLAAIASFFAPVLMSFGMKQSTDECGLLLWPLIALLVARLVRGAHERAWLWIGLCCGLAFESKYSVLFYVAALFVGLALTSGRRVFATPWFPVASVVAILIALPNALWQASHGFPMFELLHNGAQSKNLAVGPLQYLFQQVLITNLFLAPVWIAGLVRLALSRTWRNFAIAYVVLIALMIAGHGKHYYPASIYPLLFAAGGVATETLVRKRIVRGAALAYGVVAGLAFVPLALPVLSEAHVAAYDATLHAVFHVKADALATERQRHAVLPQDWADMHGWPELARTVRRVYDALPQAERRSAIVMASNYGEASAIAFFDPDIPVASGHNQWFLWGLHGYDGRVLIDVNGDCGASAHIYRSAILVATLRSPYAVSYENGAPIMLCRGPNVPLAHVWPAKREYI